MAPKDLTVRHFLGEAWREVTNVDGTFWQSLWQLTRRPGLLTNAYLDGRRQAYLRPIRLFLICNIIYFFAQPYTGFTGYNSTLYSQMHRQFYSNVLELDRVVEAHLVASGESLEAYTERFNRQSSTYARTLIIVIVPLFALGLALLFGLRRHPPIRHLVFATHFLAWHLLYMMILWSVVYQGTFLALGHVGVITQEEFEAWPGLVRHLLREHPGLPFILAFVTVSARRVYGVGWMGAVLRALLWYVAMILCVVVYRMLLFWTTFWTV